MYIEKSRFLDMIMDFDFTSCVKSLKTKKTTKFH